MKKQKIRWITNKEIVSTIKNLPAKETQDLDAQNEVLETGTGR
jgi:hypothetical protein